MPKGTRLPFRLAPRWPATLAVGGPVLVTAAWIGLGVFLLREETLRSHQLALAGTLLGVLTLLCLLGLAQTLTAAVVAPSTIVEVDSLPARRGHPLRCFVEQRGRGLRRLDVRLRCLRAGARAAEVILVDLPVGSAAPDGPSALRAHLEADVLLPADAPPSAPFHVRWCLRVAADFDAVREVVREFPLPVV
jgi:hypothetical protein